MKLLTVCITDCRDWLNYCGDQLDGIISRFLRDIREEFALTKSNLPICSAGPHAQQSRSQSQLVSVPEICQIRQTRRGNQARRVFQNKINQRVLSMETVRFDCHAKACDNLKISRASLLGWAAFTICSPVGCRLKRVSLNTNFGAFQGPAVQCTTYKATRFITNSVEQSFRKRTLPLMKSDLRLHMRLMLK